MDSKYTTVRQFIDLFLIEELHTSFQRCDLCCFHNFIASRSVLHRRQQLRNAPIIRTVWCLFVYVCVKNHLKRVSNPTKDPQEHICSWSRFDHGLCFKRQIKQMDFHAWVQYWKSSLSAGLFMQIRDIVQAENVSLRCSVACRRK